MGLSPTAQSALLKWINTISTGAEAKSVGDLKDGLILSEILGEMDSSYDPKATTKSQTLQAVVQGLFRYIRAKCDGIERLLETPGLKDISEQSSAGQMFELLIVFLMATISGPEREKYVGAITELDGPAQSEIAVIIVQKQKECAGEAAQQSNMGQDRSASASDDIELEFEVRYSTLIAQKKNLEKDKTRLSKTVADMDTRLNRLQDHNDTLQDNLERAQDALSAVSGDGDRAAFIKNLESKIREQEELIANQEGQIEQDRSERNRLRRDAERLSQATERVQQLEDDLKEKTLQNLELTKKANTLDRFKQKLESQRDFEAMNKNLEYEVEELRGQLLDYERLRQKNDSLEKTHIQFQSNLARNETEIFELGQLKKALEKDNAQAHHRIAVLEERRELDEGIIHSLQEQNHSMPQSATSPTQPSPFSNLEAELAQEQSGNRHEFENSLLKAQNQILQGNSGAAQENLRLRSELETAEATRKLLEAKAQEYFDKFVTSKAQVDAIFNASTNEGLVKGVNAAMLVADLEMLTPDFYSSVAFKALREQQQSTADELAAATKKLRETEAALESTKRDLLSATTDLSMVSDGDMEALEKLKSTQEIIYSSLEAELTTLKGRYMALEIKSEQEHRHLVEAIIVKDKLKANESEQQNLLNKVEVGVPTDFTNDLQRELAEKAEKANQDLKSAQETIKIRDRITQELSARITELESGNSDARKAELEKENTNLKREYEMMTTAWYDLTSRLQSNNVVLQRRADAPRSWINKQRQAVNNTFKR